MLQEQAIFEESLNIMRANNVEIERLFHRTYAILGIFAKDAGSQADGNQVPVDLRDVSAVSLPSARIEQQTSNLSFELDFAAIGKQSSNILDSND